MKKNKLAPPFRSFTFPIMFDSGVDTLRDTIEFGKMLGVVEKAGSYYRFEGETLGRGIMDAIANLSEDKTTLDKIKELCYNVVNGQEYHDEELEEAKDEEM